MGGECQRYIISGSAVRFRSDTKSGGPLLSLIINGYRSKLTYPRELGAPGASPSSAKIVTGNNDNVFK